MQRHSSLRSSSPLPPPPSFFPLSHVTRLSTERTYHLSPHTSPHFYTPHELKAFLATCLTLSNIIVGSGIVGLPSVVLSVGTLLFVPLLLLSAYVTRYTLSCLIQAAHLVPSPSSGFSLGGTSTTLVTYTSLPGLYRRLFGRRGQVIAALAVASLDIGVALALLIIAADLLPPLFGVSRFLFLVFASALLVPLCLLDLKHLAVSNSLSVLSVAALVCILSWRSLTTLLEDGFPRTYPPLVGHSVFPGVGTLSFVFVCHDAAFEVYNSLRFRNTAQWNQVINVSIGIAMFPILLIVISTVGSLGTRIDSNVLNSFAQDDKPINFARFLLGYSMMLTIPSNVALSRMSLIEIAPKQLQILKYFREFCTAVIVFIVLVGAFVFRELGVVQSMVGSLCSVTLAYIIPSLALIKARQISGDCKYIFSYRNAWCWALFGIGVFILLKAGFDLISSLLPIQLIKPDDPITW